jgi:hypothetical protein
MGEGAQQWRAQAERRQHAQEENDVASGPQEDRGSTRSAVGESEGCAEKVRARMHFGSRRKRSWGRFRLTSLRSRAYLA